jgi:hypothetical protein
LLIAAPAGGSRGTGLAPGVSFLRYLGDPTSDNGVFAAAGGSLLWDTREREVSAMRLALCTQPAPNAHLAASIDHTGGLSGRYTRLV